MSQQIFNCPSTRRSFTSISATDGTRGFRISQPPTCQATGPTCGNNSSQSFHNFGGRQRISYCASQHGGCCRQADFNRGCCCQHHGDQFACFIDKVQCLEQQNQMLRAKWQHLQNQNIPAARKDLKPLCDSYITNLRRKLDLVLCEKNKLEIQHKAMQNFVEESRSKYQEETNKRANAENDFVVLKKEADNIFKYQKELEIKRDLLKENIEFWKIFCAEELAMLNRQVYDTSVMLNMNNSRRLNMDGLLKGVECWYQTIAQRSKEEANLFYQKQIQNLQSKSCQLHEDLKRNNSEVAELNRRSQMFQSQVDAENKKIASLKAAISTTEQHGACAVKQAQANLLELQSTLQNSKDKLAALLRDYHDLMNTKLALDIEIATYKTMLEGEEKRIRAGQPINFAMVNNCHGVRCMKQ